MNEVSLKPVIDELEILFSKFNKAFFEGKLEKPVITVSPDHTRAKLCEVLGISRSAFYRKCNGGSEFTQGEIQKIVDFLNLETPVGIFF